jgi:hypothetical protein
VRFESRFFAPNGIDNFEPNFGRRWRRDLHYRVCQLQQDARINALAFKQADLQLFKHKLERCGGCCPVMVRRYARASRNKPQSGMQPKRAKKESGGQFLAAVSPSIDNMPRKIFGKF